jgi:simple sugar transport system permease protein
MSDAALATVLIAMIGGAIRVSTPFMFVALGETITEKSGRINLGLEGTLVLGAMVAYMTSYRTGSPWVGVLSAGGVGMLLGAILAVLAIRYLVDQVIVGVVLNVFVTRWW